MSRNETYSPEGLRVDGRRWNELRRFSCKISTHSNSADGSSYVELGLTKIICLVNGPHEPESRSHTNADQAHINVDVKILPFSTIERTKKRGKNDKRLQEMGVSIQRLFQEALLVHLYPRTVIDVSLFIVAQDGGLYSACINAATLALIDAGISMVDYVSCASTAMFGTNALLDPSYSEEKEVPFVNVAVIGKSERISLLLCESRLPLDRLETALAVSLSGCHSLRELMDKEVRAHGKSLKY